MDYRPIFGNVLMYSLGFAAWLVQECISVESFHTLLQLQRDMENRYDPDAVKVLYHNEDDGQDYCIGYIPREDNDEIATFLEMGWGEIFECRINRIVPDAHPEHQVHLTIKIKRNINHQNA